MELFSGFEPKRPDGQRLVNEKLGREEKPKAFPLGALGKVIAVEKDWLKNRGTSAKLRERVSGTGVF